MSLNPHLVAMASMRWAVRRQLANLTNHSLRTNSNSNSSNAIRRGKNIKDLVQERRNSIANALELPLSCTNPSILCFDFVSVAGTCHHHHHCHHPSSYWSNQCIYILVWTQRVKPGFMHALGNTPTLNLVLRGSLDHRTVSRSVGSQNGADPGSLGLSGAPDTGPWTP